MPYLSASTIITKTPVLADELLVRDSEALFAPKRISLTALQTLIGGSGGGTTPPVSTHQRYLAYGSDATFSVSDLTSGVSSTNNSMVVTGASGRQYVAIWSAMALTFVSNPTIFNNANLLDSQFDTATRLTISSVNGYLYVTTNSFPDGAINQTWTVR